MGSQRCRKACPNFISALQPTSLNPACWFVTQVVQMFILKSITRFYHIIQTPTNMQDCRGTKDSPKRREQQCKRFNEIQIKINKVTLFLFLFFSFKGLISRNVRVCQETRSVANLSFQLLQSYLGSTKVTNVCGLIKVNVSFYVLYLQKKNVLKMCCIK